MAGNQTIVSPLQLAGIIAKGDIDVVNGIMYDNNRVPFSISELVVDEVAEDLSPVTANADNTASE